jgi:hypothetical protein
VDGEVTEHIMVIPNAGPVRIGDGPTIETRGDDTFDYVRVDGASVYVPGGLGDLHMQSRAIPSTPYEAYAFGHWYAGQFAIRLREQS